MKKCPVCEKTFEDSMRFCQSDGTPLVEDELPLDPYKTMVASKEEIMAAMPKPIPPPAEPVPKPEEEVLELPAESDPLKTMYASEDEIRREMDKQQPPAENVIDIPPLAPEPPKFNKPSLSPPVFNEVKAQEPAAEKSPFDTPPPSPFEMSTPPVSSPFGNPAPDDQPKPPVLDPPKPNFPAFAEPVLSKPSSNPFDQPSAPAVWNPPAAPDASWQNQEIGKDTPFQPPVAGAGGLNQTLPIVSLVLGILSVCCYVSPITGIAALITGYLGMKNVKNDPANYGGKTLALVGMILGGIFFLIGAAYYIIYILIYAGLIGASMMQGY